MDTGGMPFMMGLNPGYMTVFLFTMGISLIAQFWIKSAFAKYSRVRNSRNMTGAQAAELMLKAEGITDVQVRLYPGTMLSDHYDPRTKVVNLSPDVYNSTSVAAVGVACHEAGHALQHAHHYAPLALRNLLVMPTSIGSRLSIPLIFVGLLIGSLGLAKIGLLLFGLTFLFQLITLPVEINASVRSRQALVHNNIVAPGPEAAGVSRVLTAAAFTYIAAAISSLVWLLYYASMISGRRRN